MYNTFQNEVEMVTEQMTRSDENPNMKHSTTFWKMHFINCQKDLQVSEMQ